MANSILLVSDDELFAQNLSKKLIFLRFDDKVVISDYKDALMNLKLSQAKIVLVHGNNALDLIKELSSDSELCIIFVANNYDCELITKAYDNGTSDFVMADAEDFEFVIRIVNNIKHNSVKLSALRDSKLLSQIGALDDLSGLYSYNYSKQVIENYINASMIKKGFLVALSPSQAEKEQFDSLKMSTSIRLSLRVDDIVTLGRGSNFYIFMPNIELNGVITVLDKISEDMQICAGVCEFKEQSFDKLEAEALKSLAEAYATNALYVVSQDEETGIDDWLLDEEIGAKGYKIFRKVFNKKLEKVIAPVFYQLQTVWEEKLFETDIIQYTNEDQCVFRLKNEKRDSCLKIIYPGFAKVIITVVHEGLDSPENKEIQLSLTKVTQKMLVEIIEDFIKDYKESCRR